MLFDQLPEEFGQLFGIVTETIELRGDRENIRSYYLDTFAGDLGYFGWCPTEEMSVFEGVGLGNTRETFFELSLGQFGHDEVVKGAFEASVVPENTQIFLRGEVMGLVAIGDEVGDQNLLGF